MRFESMSINFDIETERDNKLKNKMLDNWKLSEIAFLIFKEKVKTFLILN